MLIEGVHRHVVYIGEDTKFGVVPVKSTWSPEAPYFPVTHVAVTGYIKRCHRLTDNMWSLLLADRKGEIWCVAAPATFLSEYREDSRAVLAEYFGRTRFPFIVKLYAALRMFRGKVQPHVDWIEACDAEQVADHADEANAWTQSALSRVSLR
jgi:hypothetical protein